MTSLPVKLILESEIDELKMGCITDRLHIDGLESLINAGADELRVCEVIIRSPQDLKANLVANNCEGVDFGGFVCPYNILIRIQQRLKGE